MKTQKELRSKKVQHENALEDKKKNQGKEYEQMLGKFIDIKNDLDDKITKDLDDQESEFARKKRERRERSISKSMDKGKRKKDEEPVDTDNMLEGIDRKKKFESGDLDTPF